MVNPTEYKEDYMKLTALSFHLSLALALAAVGGCGIKPGKLSPPPGVAKDAYPKTYPDPSTDPKPQPANTQPANLQPESPQQP
jgi:hypothetical protein